MIRDLIRDENGKASATRAILFVAMLIFAFASFADIFGECRIDPMIWSIIQTVFAVGMGGTAIRSTVHNMRTNTQPGL